jgi:hypothetical protein
MKMRFRQLRQSKSLHSRPARLEKTSVSGSGFPVEKSPTRQICREPAREDALNALARRPSARRTQRTLDDERALAQVSPSQGERLAGPKPRVGEQ